MRPEDLKAALVTHATEDVEVTDLGEGRLACSLPISYPDGDNVDVYVVHVADGFVVTDYSGGWNTMLVVSDSDTDAWVEITASIASSLGVDSDQSRLSLSTCGDDLPDAVWRLASASACLAAALAAYPPLCSVERGAGET